MVESRLSRLALPGSDFKSEKATDSMGPFIKNAENPVNSAQVGLNQSRQKHDAAWPYRTRWDAPMRGRLRSWHVTRIVAQSISRVGDGDLQWLRVRESGASVKFEVHCDESLLQF